MGNWAPHLLKADPRDHGLMKAVEEFASTHILRWLEGMSLLGDVPGADHLLLKVSEWAVRAMIL